MATRPHGDVNPGETATGGAVGVGAGGTAPAVAVVRAPVETVARAVAATALREAVVDAAPDGVAVVVGESAADAAPDAELVGPTAGAVEVSALASPGGCSGAPWCAVHAVDSNATSARTAAAWLERIAPSCSRRSGATTSAS